MVEHREHRLAQAVLAPAKAGGLPVATATAVRAVAGRGRP